MIKETTKMSLVEREIKQITEMLRHYVDMLEQCPTRFIQNKNLIDLEHHVHRLDKVLNAESLYKEEGYSNCWQAPVFTK